MTAVASRKASSWSLFIWNLCWHLRPSPGISSKLDDQGVSTSRPVRRQEKDTNTSQVMSSAAGRQPRNIHRQSDSAFSLQHSVPLEPPETICSQEQNLSPVPSLCQPWVSIVPAKCPVYVVLGVVCMVVVAWVGTRSSARGSLEVIGQASDSSGSIGSWLEGCISQW